MKSASEKMPFVPGRMTSGMGAAGKTRPSARSAGIVIRESPTQFVPRTTTRLILSAGTLLILLQNRCYPGINAALHAPPQLVPDAFRITNITQRYGPRHPRIVLDDGFDVDHC